MHGVRFRRRPTEPSFRLGRVNVPLAWARRHKDVLVAFHAWSRDNSSAYLIGDDGAVLLSLPWEDHPNRMLAGAESEEFPTKAPEEAWWGIEQGWFACVELKGDDVYIAEGNSEDWGRLRKARKLALPRPGVLSVDGCEVRWNVTTRAAYDRALQDAISSCRAGRPSPVGKLSESQDQMRLRV